MNNKRKLSVLILFVIIASLCYLLIDSKMYNMKLFMFVLKLRIPTLLAMLISSFTIGSASIVFQSIINNRIVTPCLLGMNSMYLLIHTAIVFIAGSTSIVATNTTLAFIIDLIVMGVSATFVYWYLFKKTNHNILYVLLIGTVLSSFFGSIQSSLIRIMDPNEYDSLLTTLVADFNNINTEIIILGALILLVVAFSLRKELKLLDVITLGKDQAINLGVDYDYVIRRLLLGVVLTITVATAMVGPISFLGLIIANLSRQYFKTYKHTYLIIGSALMGMIAIIGGQVIMEHVFTFAVPISTFILVAGGIYFLYLLVFKKGV